MDERIGTYLPLGCLSAPSGLALSRNDQEGHDMRKVIAWGLISFDGGR